MHGNLRFPAMDSSSTSSSSLSATVSNASSSPDTGLLLQSTPAIKKFLYSSSQIEADDDAVPYKLVRDAWIKSPPSSRPPLREILSGCSIIFRSPEPRKKSEELKARLEKLQDLADRKAYKDLIKDVAPIQEEIEYFSSYRDQLGFGLHVVVIMFTGYLCGHALFRSQFGGSAVLHAAGGIFGLVLGMLVETLLFIIRASKLDKQQPKLKKKAGPYSSSRYKED